MKLEWKQLVRVRPFLDCRTLTAPAGARISGLLLAPEPCEGEGGRLLLLCPSEPLDGAALARTLAALGYAGAVLPPELLPEEEEGTLIGPFRDRGLVLASAPMSAWTAMLQVWPTLLASRSDGLVKPVEAVLDELQQTFCQRGAIPLLDCLSYWTGCQTALFVGQDSCVRPPMPVLGEAFFSTSGWRRDQSRERLSQVAFFRSLRDGHGLLQATIRRDKLPTGVLCLMEGETPFHPADHLLLSFTALLCSGMDDCRDRTCRIEGAISALSRGRAAAPEALALFPEAGYALMLTPEEAGPVQPAQLDYLSYLLQYYFHHRLCYSFDDKLALRIFTAAEDIDQFTRSLLQRLRGAGKAYRAGVSRLYSIQDGAAAFSEAQSAAHIGRLLEKEDPVTYYQQLGIYRLLNYTENARPVNQLLGEMDALLNRMDKEKRDILSKTLRTFVSCRFHYQQTADKLYTHVNTIRYRIKLIEDLWDVDLSSDEGKLMFSVLAKLLPLWMKSGGYAGELPEDEGETD